MVRFFVGVHEVCDARRFDQAFVSVRRLEKRKRAFHPNDWIMDSGAFTTIATHGGYPEPVEVYAAQIRRWASCGRLLAAIAQDYMCEPWMLAKTGLTIADHQRLTIERYDELVACDCGGVYVMPVLQGYAPDDYAAHVRMYGDRLAPGAWVGVGSICKRNTSFAAIRDVLDAILRERPDFKLHAFGIKTTSLAYASVRDKLHSADSMAWSFAARWEGRKGHDWREAARFAARISRQTPQLELFA